MTLTLNEEDLKNVLKECEAQQDVPPMDEVEAWGVDPQAMYNIMRFFIYRSAQRIQEGAEIEQILGSLFYSGFTVGTKVQLELEMRRIAESAP